MKLRLFFAPALGGVVLGLGLVAPARAFAPTGRIWAAGDIVMHLQLGTPGAALSDGFTTWGEVAETALNEWNAQITRNRFTVVRNSTATKAEGNRTNNVFFDSTVYGDAWGSGVLAVTLSYRNSRNTTESDVVFNSTRTWDSYRGPLRRNTMDFRRVALHEFGHVLGLDHPDQAAPPQSVAAIMNSTASNTETLQADDISHCGSSKRDHRPRRTMHRQCRRVVRIHRPSAGCRAGAAATGDAGPKGSSARARRAKRRRRRR